MPASPSATAQARILQFDITKYRVNDSFAEDKQMVDYITPHINNLKEYQAVSIAKALKEYDPKGVRQGPNAIAKGLLEILRKHVYAGNVHADCAALHAGSFRRTEVIPQGDITRGDILSILKFDEPTCVIKVTGKMLWDLIQQSEDKFATSGKTTKTGTKSASGYLQVAGVEYKTNGGRITSMEVRSLTGKVTPVKRDHSSEWRIATSKYIADCVNTPEAAARSPSTRGYMFRKFGENYGKALENSLALSWNGNPSAFEVVRRYYESQKIVNDGELPIFMEESFADVEKFQHLPALESDSDSSDPESLSASTSEMSMRDEDTQDDLLSNAKYNASGPSIWYLKENPHDLRYERMSRMSHGVLA